MTTLPDKAGQRTPKLGPRQRAFLARIAHCNGCVFGWTAGDRKVLSRLAKRGLVLLRGRRFTRAVVTLSGLELHRALAVDGP